MDPCAAVVVTYFPTRQNIHHLLKLKQLCGLLVIIDNSATGRLLEPVQSNHLIIICNEINMGLSAALNQGIEIAGNAGYDNIFLFDQDTIIPGNYLKRMVQFRSEYENTVSEHVLIVPNFIDRNSGTYARFPLLMPFRVSFCSCKNIATLKKKQSLIAITSGTLLTYATYRSLGSFKEDYFIDFIDHEYCLRAAIKGYKIIPNCDAVIHHAIGQRSVHSILGMTIKPTHHSALRRYYFTRNSIRTLMTYFSTYPAYTLLVLVHISHEIVSSFMYEKNSLKKIKAIGYGMLHGLLNRMGACKINLT